MRDHQRTPEEATRSLRPSRSIVSQIKFTIQFRHSSRIFILSSKVPTNIHPSSRPLMPLLVLFHLSHLVPFQTGIVLLPATLLISSATGTPTSACFSTPGNRSTENRFFFISKPLRRATF